MKAKSLSLLLCLLVCLTIASAHKEGCHHDHSEGEEHVHDYNHVHEDDLISEEGTGEGTVRQRVAKPPDFELDYDEQNLHHKYADIEEFEEEDEGGWEQGSSEEEDFGDVESSDEHEHEDIFTDESYEWLLLPLDWPRLINFPEVGTEEQYEALVKSESLRQAAHVFLYFVDVQSWECYDQLDEVNEAWLSAVRTYGADSVAFYKVTSGLFRQDLEVYTYPALVYADPNEDFNGARRLLSRQITKSQIAKFVMDCVENQLNKEEQRQYRSYELSEPIELDKVSKETLNHDLQQALSFIEELQEALAHMEEHHQHEHFVGSSYEEDDELVIEILIDQAERLVATTSQVLIPSKEQTNGELALIQDLVSQAQESQTKSSLELDQIGRLIAKQNSPDFLSLLVLGSLGFLVGFLGSLFAIDHIVRLLQSKMAVIDGGKALISDEEKAIGQNRTKVALD